MRVVLPAEPLIDGPTAVRPWRESDIPVLVAACQDPEIPRWTRVPTPYGESDARAFMQQRYGWIHHGTAAPFAIVSRSDQARLLGSISLMRFVWEHARAEVGYWLAREARGQGHATRAVRLLCRWGFATLRLERVELLAASENPTSQRVAERCGFIREALLRSYLRVKDRRLDVAAFGLLTNELERASDWG